jgi:hypothetical protein
MLRSYATNNFDMKHYLEPSVLAPICFVQYIPQHVKDCVESLSSLTSSSNNINQMNNNNTDASSAQPLFVIVTNLHVPFNDKDAVVCCC